MALRIGLVLSALLFTSAQSVYSAEPVSLVAFIASPQAYDQKQITLSGVLGLDNKGRITLYLDEGSRQNGVIANSVMVLSDRISASDVSKHDGKYVRVIGTADSTGPMVPHHAGRIVDVLRIIPYEP